MDAVGWIVLLAGVVIGVLLMLVAPKCKKHLGRFLQTEIGRKASFSVFVLAVLGSGWFVGWHGTAVTLACVTLAVLIVNLVTLIAVVNGEGRYFSPATELLTFVAFAVDGLIVVVWLNALVHTLTGGVQPMTWGTFFR